MEERSYIDGTRLTRQKQLIINQQYYPDVNVEYDSICFEDLLEHNLKDCIYHLVHEGYQLSNVFNVKVAAGRHFIPEYDYDVDWSTLTLNTYKPMINTTYTLLIYVDLGKIHEIEQKLHRQDMYKGSDKHIKDIDI